MLLPIHRWKWFWEAWETIVAMGDTIDLTSHQRELEKSGHYEDVTAYKPLICYVHQGDAACRDGAFYDDVLGKLQALAQRY